MQCVITNFQEKKNKTIFEITKTITKKTQQDKQKNSKENSQWT